MDVTDENNSKIGVSAQWFTINQSDKSLKVCEMENHGLMPITCYHLTIPPPIVLNNTRNIIENTVYNEICKLIRN